MLFKIYQRNQSPEVYQVWHVVVFWYVLKIYDFFKQTLATTVVRGDVSCGKWTLFLFSHPVRQYFPTVHPFVYIIINVCKFEWHNIANCVSVCWGGLVQVMDWRIGCRVQLDDIYDGDRFNQGNKCKATPCDVLVGTITMWYDTIDVIQWSMTGRGLIWWVWEWVNRRKIFGI